MASAEKNLSDYSNKNITDISEKSFGIVVSEWNEEVTGALFEGAYNTLLANGAKENNIIKIDVPGSFELTLGSQRLAQRTDIDAVIAIGCVIQGETKHFEFHESSKLFCFLCSRFNQLAFLLQF